MLEGVVVDDAQLFNPSSKEWADFSNLTAPTEAWAGKPFTNAHARRPGPRLSGATVSCTGRSCLYLSDTL
jgi:hypothetical protein